MHRRARMNRSHNNWIKTTVEEWNENSIIAFSTLYDMLRDTKKVAKEYLKRLRKTNKKLYVKVIKMFRTWDNDKVQKQKGQLRRNYLR